MAPGARELQRWNRMEKEAVVAGGKKSGGNGEKWK
jgi:hypothetical protein